MRIGIDVDGVLRNWDASLIRMIKRYYPDKIINGRDIESWTWKNLDLPIEYVRYLFSVKHVDEVYLDAEPYKDAITQFGMLLTYAKLNNHQLVCVSHQWDDTIPATLSWLGKYGFSFHEILFTEDKYLTDVDVLIDDSPKNYKEWVDNGRDSGSFFVFDHHYNRECGAIIRIKQLIDAIPHIK